MWTVNYHSLTVIIVVVYLIFSTAETLESYTVNRLNAGAVVINIEFKVEGNYVRSCDSSGTFCVDDYGSFPISIARVLLNSKADNVALSMARGSWREDTWGTFPSNLGDLSPSGALLRAQFPGYDGEERGFGIKWRQLRALVSGIFCASLNEDTVKSSPFDLSYLSFMKSIAQYYPEESVCTENIDAWVKLLPQFASHKKERSEDDPCNSNSNSNSNSSSSDDSSFGNSDNSDIEKCSNANPNPKPGPNVRGLASLVRADWLLRSPWHSLSIKANIDPNPNPNSNPNPKSNSNSNPNPNPNSNTNSNSNFNLNNNIKKRRVSMVITISAVLVPSLLLVHSNLLKELEGFSNNPNPNPNLLQELEGFSGNIVKYSSNSSNSEATSTPNSNSNSTPNSNSNLNPYPNSVSPLNSLRLSRTVRDSRESHFSVKMGVYNNNKNYNDTSDSVRVHVVEVIPPFYDILLHTYKYTIIRGHDSSHSSSHANSEYSLDPYVTKQCGTDQYVTYYVADLSSFIYTPKGLDDQECFGSITYGATIKTPAVKPCFGSVSWSIDLPPGYSVKSSFKAIKRMLKREEYPADASRGLEVPPVLASLTLTEREGSRERGIETRILNSESTLITFPIPDASMPFNIITMVSTVMAFLLGSMINALVRTKKEE